jgi:hypothetical protein
MKNRPNPLVWSSEPGRFRAEQIGNNYLTTGGATGAVGATAVFLTAFFTLVECFLAVVLVPVAAGAAGVVAGAVCAKEIPARARVMERAAMVFILCGFLFPRRCCLSASVI